MATLEQHHAAILVKIREANGVTEREVLAVGEALRCIVDEARAYVADSRSTLEQFASTSVTEMLERHGAVMSTFVDTLQEQMSTQNEAVQQATNQINRIVELGRAIERVTMESKILALNANIHARRLGAAGESFLVIAQEMKQFSESVNNANKSVQELASSLLSALPRIGTLASAMRETSEEFSADLSDRVAEVAAANTEMKRQVAESMASGETRLEQIMRVSYDALSHLQFQDPVAQSLLTCDREISDCLRLAQAWLTDGDAALSAKDGPESERSAEPLVDAGKVMLF